MRINVNTANINIYYALLLTFFFSCISCQTISEKPNIILIVTDDQGWGDVGYQGCMDIPTPTLDRLANQGIRFSEGYVSHPYCAPSRAGLLTGTYQSHIGFSNNPPSTPDETIGVSLASPFISSVLHKKGYKTGAIGKWHLGAHDIYSPLARGFDYWFGFATGGFNYWGEPSKREDGEYTYVMRNKDTVTADQISYLTDDFTNEAIDFIQRNKDEAFFLYLAYNAPHKPDQVTAEYLKLTEHIEYPERSVYGAMVAAIDQNIERLDQVLVKSGLKENTILIFLSDNGGRPTESENRPFRGHKGMLFEGGIRVPFFIHCPSRFEPQTYSQAISSLDLYPTILDWCGIKVPDSIRLDGINLNPYLINAELEIKRSLFWMTGSGKDMEYAIRKRNYKLVHAGLTKGKTFLFDLEEDPGERNDLSALEPGIKAELEAEVHNWLKSNKPSHWEDSHIPYSNKRTERWKTYRLNAAKGEVQK